MKVKNGDDRRKLSAAELVNTTKLVHFECKIQRTILLIFIESETIAKILDLTKLNSFQFVRGGESASLKPFDF